MSEIYNPIRKSTFSTQGFSSKEDLNIKKQKLPPLKIQPSTLTIKEIGLNGQGTPKMSKLSNFNTPELKSRHKGSMRSSNVLDVNIFNLPETNKKQREIFYKKILDNFYFNALINILIIFALFADDFRIILFPKSVDDLFNSLTIFCMICFSFEIFLSIMIKPDYFNSFFFWLDTLSTITLLFDLTWVNQNFSSNR